MVQDDSDVQRKVGTIIIITYSNQLLQHTLYFCSASLFLAIAVIEFSFFLQERTQSILSTLIQLWPCLEVTGILGLYQKK